MSKWVPKGIEPVTVGKGPEGPSAAPGARLRGLMERAGKCPAGGGPRKCPAARCYERLLLCTFRSAYDPYRPPLPCADDRADGTDRAAEERRRETLGGHVAELEARRRRSRRRSARQLQGNGGPRAERCEKGRRESSAPPAPRAVHQPKGVRAQRLATQWLL